MIRNNPIYDNIPGVREGRKRMEAQQALRTGAYPSGNPFDQSVKRGLMGEAGMDESAIRSAGILSPEREAMSNASRYAANYQALADAGVPGLSQGMPSGGSSGGRMAPKKPDPFAPGAGYQATDPSDPYYSKRPRKPMRLAEGGPVEGPGGPKDDLINAKLSDGEFVMPAEVVKFYGLDRLYKMMAKANEGLNEIKPAPQALPTPLPMMMGNPMGQDRTAMKRDNLERFIASVLPPPTPLPVTMPQPTPAFAYGGMAQSMPVPGFNRGGQFDSEESPTDAMDPLPQAIAAQQRAVEANQNPSFLDYYFPTEGFEASEQASRATQQANDALGEFFDEEAVKDYDFRANSQRQKILMEENRLLNDPAWVQANPGHYNQIIKQYKKDLNYTEQPMAGPQRLTAVVGDQAYGPTLNDSPAFQPRLAAPAVAVRQQPQNIIRRLAPNPYSVGPGYSLTPMDPVAPAPAVSPSPTPQVPFVADPATLAAMRSRRADLRAGQPLLTAPEGLLAQGRAVLDALPPAQAPMDVPLMRPAPLTMTEKEQQAKPISRSRTPEANPEFEAAFAGLTGMQKRRARQGLQMEEATNQRNQARADIAQAEIDARNERIRVQTLQDQRDNMIIADQIRQAAENRNIGNTAALNAAQQKDAEDKAKQQAEENRRFRPVLDDQGNPIPGRLMNTQSQQLNLNEQTQAPKINPSAAKALLTSPQASTLDANTLAEIVSDTRYDLATRELARRQLAKAPPPETGRTVMSGGKPVILNKDGTYQDAIDLDATTTEEKVAAFKAVYGRAPGQTNEEDWKQAFSLAREAKQKARTSPAPAAGTAAPRAKIKSITPAK